MLTPLLPQELQDLVVDYLPTKVLKNASLVSRAWCWHSRKNLFRRVRVCPSFTAVEESLQDHTYLRVCVEELVLFGKENNKTVNDDVMEENREASLVTTVSATDMVTIFASLPRS